MASLLRSWKTRDLQARPEHVDEGGLLVAVQQKCDSSRVRGIQRSGARLGKHRIHVVYVQFGTDKTDEYLERRLRALVKRMWEDGLEKAACLSKAFSLSAKSVDFDLSRSDRLNMNGVWSPSGEKLFFMPS